METHISETNQRVRDEYLRRKVDRKTAKNPTLARKSSIPKKLERSLSFSQGHGGRMGRYFTHESLFVLVCLTASLLILPLILPPLPPPPFMLLMIPICILGLLMILAFNPSKKTLV